MSKVLDKFRQMKAHLGMMKNVFVVQFFFIKISCSFQKLSDIQTSYNIQEEIWKQMLISISRIKNKLGMELS